MQFVAVINPFTPKGSLFDDLKSSGVRQNKLYKVTLGGEGVKGDSFLTLSLPRGLSTDLEPSTRYLFS